MKYFLDLPHVYKPDKLALAYFAYTPQLMYRWAVANGICGRDDPPIKCDVEGFLHFVKTLGLTRTKCSVSFLGYMPVYGCVKVGDIEYNGHIMYRVNGNTIDVVNHEYIRSMGYGVQDEEYIRLASQINAPIFAYAYISSTAGVVAVPTLKYISFIMISSVKEFPVNKLDYLYEEVIERFKEDAKYGLMSGWRSVNTEPLLI